MEKNEAELCFTLTNDEIHIPRAPREEEREILDETRLIMIRSKPDYFEFVLLEELLMLLLWFSLL